MSTSPQKVQGAWSQGIYEISATAKEIVGTKREDQFGNVYRYAKAGATALDPGKMTTSPLLSGDWTNESVTTAVPVGGTQVTITHVAVGSDVLAANYFAGGQLQINDAAGKGTWYRIVSSTEMTAASTTCTFTLQEGVKVALTTSSEATPVPSPWMATVVSETETHNATGTPLVEVTAAYYYWSQTKGLGVYLSDGTPDAGSPLVMSDEDGQLMSYVLDHDATSDETRLEVIVAVAYGTDGRNGEYCPCVYCID